MSIICRRKDYLLILKRAKNPSCLVSAIETYLGKTKQEACALVELNQFKMIDVILKSKMSFDEALSYKKLFEPTESILYIISERHYVRHFQEKAKERIPTCDRS